MKTEYLDKQIEFLEELKNDNDALPFELEQLQEYKDIKKQLTLTDVSNCNDKKDTNIENTILFISRKDGLTDVYDNSGCLGKGLDTQGINDLNIT